PAAQLARIPFPTRRSSDLRRQMHARGKLEQVTIESLQADKTGAEKLSPGTIFAELGQSPLQAAQLTSAYLQARGDARELMDAARDRKSTRLNSSHVKISYA